MSQSNSEILEETLAKDDLHGNWRNRYLNEENDRFYENLFDHVANALDAPPGATILDAGCGDCSHAIRLAKRGFCIQGIDFSEAALKIAKQNIEANGLQDTIQIQRGSLLSLPSENETFDYIFCWGVLMHIPEVETALSELTRVLKQGGKLAIGENNMFALQSVARRTVRRFIGRKKLTTTVTPAGIEYWKDTSAGKLLAREANIGWLIKSLDKRGLILEERVAGQFTELYCKMPTPRLRKGVHAFNNFWFKYVRAPHLAAGNFLVFRKYISARANC